MHRGAESSFDVSADLREFSLSPVGVICAGAKSILDLPKTLEYLETQGCPVLGWKTSEFPSFFTRSSGLKLAKSQVLHDATHAAEVLLLQTSPGIKQGLVICNPIPQEDECQAAEKAIQLAVKEADEMKPERIQGKELTPFLLKRVNEMTKGASLRANISLVENNARVGG